MRTERYLRLVEATLWVAAVAGAAIVASLALGLLVGGDLNAGKYAMFVVGFLMFGLGTLAIQPSSPNPGDDVPDDADRGSDGDGAGGLVGGPSDDPEFGFEARLQEVGPLADHDLPHERRVDRGAKLFAASLVVLGVSLLMEFAGVQV